ncbi:hypothetical protein BJ508DRAFT_23877 [Ascobolus immersus RN42]|uniref:Uncharacterized protein n=1 Tax=Ascobolus immersus RN42 TaxID=1160509 RepID=A0A3N4HZU7_ASCIM|nr:hypothetical protein BJ508DRAFT_23877 [Ascobolus immersus RN42]
MPSTCSFVPPVRFRPALPSTGVQIPRRHLQSGPVLNGILGGILTLAYNIITLAITSGWLKCFRTVRLHIRVFEEVFRIDNWLVNPAESDGQGERSEVHINAHA